MPVGLALALPAVWLARCPRVATSLYDMMGREGERIPQFVRDLSSREVSVIVSSPDRKAAEAAASELRRQYPSSPSIPEGAVEFLRRERSGLVSPEAAKLLETTEGREKLFRRALRRFYTNPIPPLLGWRDDPFLLAEGFISSLDTGRTVIETNGLTHVLVKLDGLPPTLAQTLSPAHPPNISYLISHISYLICGAPVHAARAEKRCKREINYLTAFSCAFIVLLSVVAFRSFRWIPLLACSLLVSALSGAIALCLAFAEIHLMTLAFGTTVLGLVIDYSYHWLFSDPTKLAATRRSMVLSFLTTEISLLPLVMSSIPVLRQSAVFLGVGLLAAIVYVLLTYPQFVAWRGRPAHGKVMPCIGIRMLSIAIFAIAMVGMLRLSVGTDVTSLYRPPADLLAAERLRSLFGSFDFAAFPSLHERARLSKLAETLYAEKGKALVGEGMADSLVPPPEPTFDFVSPKVFVNRILSRWTSSALMWLTVSLAVMFAVLACFFRRRAFRVFLPSLAALLAVAGILSAFGVTLNLFHLLACFLLAGMGVDYTVFLHSGESSAMRSVTCSLLTSMTGFGALVFVSMPIVASFGQILGLGLPLAFLFALALMPADAEDGVEKAASPVGLETLWWLYRLFGLRVLHLASSSVGVSAWLFSPAVRRTSPSLRKVVNFTVALADRLVVMADGRNLPSVVTDDSDDARAFVDDVLNGRGVFVLSSHVGVIEVLVAMGECSCTFHAWMDFVRTGVFTRFYMRHVKRERVVIHPIADFGMGAVFEAGSLLDDGDCVLMAGDRGDGAFRFAAAFDHPVYFVACLREGGCRYRAVIRRLPNDRKSMKSRYGEILADLTSRYPDQSYDFR